MLNEYIFLIIALVTTIINLTILIVFIRINSTKSINLKIEKEVEVLINKTIKMRNEDIVNSENSTVKNNNLNDEGTVVLEENKI